MAESAVSLVQFAPFTSSVDSGFWWKLSEKKLNEYKLDDSAASIKGYYYNGDPPNISGRLNVDYTAFNEPWQQLPRSFLSYGSLLSKNTIEEFRECNKKELLYASAEEIFDLIKSGAALKNPSLLNRFILLTFVDLKKYCFYYWFAFPALVYPDNFTFTNATQRVHQYFRGVQVDTFVSSWDVFHKGDAENAYFLVHVVDDLVTVHTLLSFEALHSQPGKVLLGFCDPCTLEIHPGWPLRNFLMLAAYHWKEKVATTGVLCFRERFRDGVRDISHSLVLEIAIPIDVVPHSTPDCVGWEVNEKMRKGPRKVDLSATMDPRKLAETSVDLNLKLMRWRLVPSLDLDCIRNTRCLLLGSGTLGCNVARCLMGWGVRNITLVDNGKVSFSNPVRQSLFNFEDCLNGGKPKSVTAAEALRKIFPEMNAVGVELSIPMPGHFVPNSAVDLVKEDFARLEQLIEDHDVVFLVTDTRESRWLPTVIANVKSKLVINAALGFDTFLVMRHGAKNRKKPEMGAGDSCTRNQSLNGDELGCYFCNDVVAPGDSTQYRTMDQQCTVTRPGISYIASAMAVELMVSVLQHPDKGCAPAQVTVDEEPFSVGTTALGIIPHQIRGFLSRFYHILPVCRSFDKCTGCSNKVLDEYAKEGFSFALNAFNQPSFLEDLTGLTELHADLNESEVWELSDDDLSSVGE